MQKPRYSADEEQLLMAQLWSPQIKDDPEAFVLFCFPWGQPNTPLERFKGPRAWQRRTLRRIADFIRTNRGKLDQGELIDALRRAVSSGRGVGKSALVSWLILWMLSTRTASQGDLGRVDQVDHDGDQLALVGADRHEPPACPVADRAGRAGLEEGHPVLGCRGQVVVRREPGRLRRGP